MNVIIPPTYGIDYSETFAFVAKMNTIKILISLAAHFGWPLLQYDIENGFLHGELNEVIYMKISPQYNNQQRDNMASRLKNSLY